MQKTRNNLGGTMKTLITNIGMLATATGSAAKKGAEQGNVSLTTNTWLIMENDKIAQVGTANQAVPAGADKTIDARGQLVTAGLVDSHTHLVFGGWREHELTMKLKKVTYLEILAQGGGILSTVNNTRKATKEELKAKTKKLLDRMLRLGVTTVEAKSGYGLTTETELKMLEVVKELQQEEKISLVSTFMGAHALPTDYKDKRDAYIDLVINETLPQVVEKHLAEFIDVFCEQGVFTPEESKKILLAGKKAGLGIKCHSDEIVPIGGTPMAAELGAISCEHLIKADAKGIAAMAQSGTIACLLPGTSFYLNSTYAPARDMINKGVPVAFGSDFNPGSCPSNSLQLAMHIGCYKYEMTPEECLTAVTLNGAAAINRAKTLGTVETGKQADLIIWDAPNLDYLFYRYGDNLVDTVIKNGEVLVTNPR
jgi:imidazolonepropionase